MFFNSKKYSETKTYNSKSQYFLKKTKTIISPLYKVIFLNVEYKKYSIIIISTLFAFEFDKVLWHNTKEETCRRGEYKNVFHLLTSFPHLCE